MSKLKRLVERLITKCLNRLMDRGYSHLVYRVSNYWGTKCGINLLGPFYSAAWSVQERLTREFGYHECSSCGWAVTSGREHMTEGSYCLAQEKREIEEDLQAWHEIREQEEWQRRDNEEPD